MTAELPLAGRRVVVTRAADQADELADLLRGRGAVPVVVPLIEIAAEPAGIAALATLDTAAFDLLVVTSPNAAAAFLTAARPAPAAVAAVGTATAAALRDGGVPVTMIPRHQRATGLLEELPPGPGRVLVVQAAGAEATLADGLRAKGYEVVAVAAHRAVPARPTAAVQLAALAADAVLFASGSAARAWVDVFGDSTPPVVVAIGPQTAEAAHAAGLKVTLVAADHSVSGLVSALERYLAGQE